MSYHESVYNSSLDIEAGKLIIVKTIIILKLW